MMLFSELHQIVQGEVINLRTDEEIRYLLTDSRKANSIKGSLFFAIRGVRHDGHHYIQDLCKRGIRNFIIEKDISVPNGANLIRVDSSLRAL
ncbi:MAG: Mur ligase domain-containing protein, partial [Bacteroidota bacterium]